MTTSSTSMTKSLFYEVLQKASLRQVSNANLPLNEDAMLIISDTSVRRDDALRFLIAS